MGLRANRNFGQMVALYKRRKLERQKMRSLLKISRRSY